MKKVLMVLALAVLGMASTVLTGCKKAEPTAPAAAPAAAVKKVAEQPAAALPAEQKPKDHPAH